MPCRPAISSQSLGRAWEHALYPKLQAASEAGFEGIEVFYEDLAYLANVYTQERLEDHGATESSEAISSDPSEGDLLRAAQDVRDWCTQLKLEIIALQPFQNFDGLASPSTHKERLTQLRLWLRLCHKLQTHTILIPSSTLPADQLRETSISPSLSEAADLAAKEAPPIRLAYEALAWGTLVNTWDKSWAHVQRSGRENLGICIDTFNLAGRVHADPTSPSLDDDDDDGGKVANAEEELKRSLELLRKVDVHKVFYVQLVDAERMERPLVKGHAWYREEQPARMSWSRNARLFAYEEGGYLPVRRIMEVLLRECKYEGWISMELFSRDLVESSSSVPKEHAERGMESWRKLQEEFGL